MSKQSLNERRGYVVACDIGGTKMRCALVARDGSIHDRVECSTDPDKGLSDATGRMTGLIRDSLANASIDSVAGISISSAGPIKPESGVYDHPPNLPGWHGHSMIPDLQRTFGLPVRVVHDAHAAALAEAHFGAARHTSDVVYVTVSTGIGGGILSGGIPVNGANGLAGEIGHMIIDPSGPACNAGCRGCLEVLASGSGSASEAQRRVAAGIETSILGLAGGEVSNINAKHVYLAARSGDTAAREIVALAIESLASGLANLLVTFDPGVLVLGGSVITGDNQTGGLSDYWDELQDRVKQRILLRYKKELPIVKSSLGDDVGLIGAAAFMFNNRQDQH